MKKKQLILPAMLDAHFDLLQYAFQSKSFETVVLTNTKEVISVGLSYAHNDLCYPGVLIIGQLIAAVREGIVDPQNSVFLIPQAGDACRGSNYLFLIRKALHFADIFIPVVSLNFLDMEESCQFRITPGMLWRALAAILYSDMLLLLRNQVEPYEVNQGETAALHARWIHELQHDLSQNKHLQIHQITRNFQQIAAAFHAIHRTKQSRLRIGVVGELYIKYCGMGNHQLLQFLQKNGAEPVVNGFSWYVLYYAHTHLLEEGVVSPILRCAYRAAMAGIEWMQRQMVKAIRAEGFFCFDTFRGFEKTTRAQYSNTCAIGDGWLIGGEICNFSAMGVNRVACIQPFGCMPNHVCGKGIYAALQRALPQMQLVSIDYDASDSEINLQNRAAMLLF